MGVTHLFATAITILPTHTHMQALFWTFFPFLGLFSTAQDNTPFRRCYMLATDGDVMRLQ